MLTIAKLFADIAKALNAPTWLITHGITVIIFGGGAWAISSYVHSKNQKIESVPAISQKLDTVVLMVVNLNNRFTNFETINRAGHDSISSNIRKGFGDVKNAMTKEYQLTNEKFRAINKNFDAQFDFQNRWYLETIDALNKYSLFEKKNSKLYQTALLNPYLKKVE